MAITHFNQITKTITRHWEAFVSHGGMFPRSGASPADAQPRQQLTRRNQHSLALIRRRPS